MKLSTIFNFSILLLFTLLFINDFFPTTTLAETLPKKIILLILIGLIIVQMTMSKGTAFKLSKKVYFGLTIYTVVFGLCLYYLVGSHRLA